MKKILFIILCVLCSATCGTPKNIPTTVKQVTSKPILVDIDKIITVHEYEELCQQDTAILNHRKWMRFGYVNDNEDDMNHWVYIKSLPNGSLFSLIHLTDSTYRLTIKKAHKQM
jgi:hypothetical protein